jgi:hypothetical protein
MTCAAFAQVDVGPAHPALPTFNQIITDYNNGILKLKDLRQMGLSVFATPFNTYDGLGDGPFDASETDTAAFGHRPTLQGNGLFLRLNGLDAQSCNECHTIVSNRSRLPTLGLGGVGGVVQNAVIMPTMIDIADSMDDRTVYQPGHDPDLPLTFDGVADYNGRFANPPFLFGGGGVEALGKEMTRDLQDYLDVAQNSPAGTTVSLDTHGVNFGSITSLGGGNVQLDVEGIGFEDNSLHSAEEVLVVRPFGRKGENFSMRDFDRGAMQFHFGIQPNEVVDPGGLGGVDEDGDSVIDEATVAEMTVLHVFDVTNPRPEIPRLTRKARQGFENFMDIGCGDCHMPALVTESRYLGLAHPEEATDPDANVYLEIDLRKVGFDRDRGGAGVVVPLFSDLKRHDMGPRLAETFERGELPNEEFITARLWGIADTAPYLHDGRATTLYEAIEFHGGEAQYARDNYLNQSNADQERVLEFLLSLRTPVKPNEDLLPL